MLAALVAAPILKLCEEKHDASQEAGRNCLMCSENTWRVKKDWFLNINSGLFGAVQLRKCFDKAM